MWVPGQGHQPVPTPQCVRQPWESRSLEGTHVHRGCLLSSCSELRLGGQGEAAPAYRGGKVCGQWGLAARAAAWTLASVGGAACLACLGSWGLPWCLPGCLQTPAYTGRQSWSGPSLGPVTPRSSTTAPKTVSKHRFWGARLQRASGLVLWEGKHWSEAEAARASPARLGWHQRRSAGYVISHNRVWLLGVQRPG